ncbi:MAG TPA: ribonuclease HII, partial [Candidatus Moranbacteria bacterium]|nr:ribonuclease HII [Candidatus Moranbacteria bacterium]
MIKSTFDLENKLRSGGYGLIIGIDEAGRGPLAGPVVACAAAVRKSELLNPEVGTEELNLVRDSKTLSEKQREKLFGFIMDNFHVGVGICDHKTVDRVNILEASFLAMKKAVTELVASIKYNVSSMGDKTQNKNSIIHNTKYILLVDGNKKIPNFSMEQKAITSGDKHIKSISAASIIAKVTRDRIMKEMHEKYPEYNFAKHKGYGTKLHKEMIA